MRWVDDKFSVHEDFLELCLLPHSDAESVTRVITDALLRYQLPVSNCRGQCYDGASVMAGQVTGVSKRISDMESRAAYVHCMALSLNLAVHESVRLLPVYRDMIEYVKNITNLICVSPKRSAILVALQQDGEDRPVNHQGLRPLCPTRWTTRHQSIVALLENYAYVQETLREVAEVDKSESGTKANGLADTMQSFLFYFSLKSGAVVFNVTEMLSKTIQ